MIRWYATPGKTEILIELANELVADVRQNLEDDARRFAADIFVSEADTTVFVLQFKDVETTEFYAEHLVGICPREGGIEIVARGRIN